MATQTYKIDLVCENCGRNQTERLPVGSPFIAYGQECRRKKRKKHDHINYPSGYRKNYGTEAGITIKRCSSCRTAMLVRAEDKNAS